LPERVCQRPGCGRVISSRKRRDTRWCSRSCESKARRAAKRRAAFKDAHPEAAELIPAEEQSLTDLYARAAPPVHRADLESGHVDDDLLEHSDYHDVGVYEQDDDQGIYSGPGRGGDPVRDRIHAAGNLRAAVDAITADYDRRTEKYIAQQRRNPGRVQPELAALLRDRDSKIRELTRAHQHAEALERADRRQLLNQVSAHERQVEQAAARSFALDLGRGRFLRADPGQAGRSTSDIAVW
jgi:hypothetical protein